MHWLYVSFLVTFCSCLSHCDAQGNLVQNGDFGDWPTGLGPADWTWTVGVGAFQYGGEIYGTVSQQLTTVPGQTYQLQFSMAGNPNYSAQETLNIYWENSLVGSNTWYPNGHGYSNLGYIEVSYAVVATMPISLLTFENANSGAPGAIPFLEHVSVEIPEPSTLVLASLGTCILVGWAGCKKSKCFISI